jgi:hypothetical protein
VCSMLINQRMQDTRSTFQALANDQIVTESTADDAKQAQDIKVRANLDFSHLGFNNAFFLCMAQFRVLLVMLCASAIMPVQQGLRLLHGLSARTIFPEDAKAAILLFLKDKCCPTSVEQHSATLANLVKSATALAAAGTADNVSDIATGSPRDAVALPPAGHSATVSTGIVDTDSRKGKVRKGAHIFPWRLCKSVAQALNMHAFASHYTFE